MSKISPVPSNNDDNSETHRVFYKKSEFYFLLLFCSLIVGVGFLIKYACDEIKDHPYISFTFDVDFLEVTSITSNQLDKAHLRLNLTVTTKEAEFFKTLQVSVEYDHQLVSNTTIAPFHQDGLTQKTIPVQIGMADTRLLPNKVSDSIITKLASEGVLDFTVIFRGNNWNEYGESCDMKMVCKGVRVTLSSTNNVWNGSTKDGPFPCKYSTKGCGNY